MGVCDRELAARLERLELIGAQVARQERETRTGLFWLSILALVGLSICIAHL